MSTQPPANTLSPLRLILALWTALATLTIAHARQAPPPAPAPQPAPQAQPQPQPRATAEQLEALVIALGSRPHTPQERADLLLAIDRARAQLISALPDDDRAPSWALDRAAAALEELADDAADWSVLLGIPTDGQRTRAISSAQRALDLVAWAESASTRAVARLQTSVLAARTDAAAARAAAEAAEARLGVLIDLEQQVRIPFYRGRAAALLVAADPAQRTGDRAREALESLVPLRLTGAPESVRRATLAAVLIAVTTEPGPRRDAADLVRPVVSAPPPATPDSADAVARACARMALLRAAASPDAYAAARTDLLNASSRPPFIVAAPGVAPVTRADPALAILAAEVIAIGAVEHARAVPADRRAAWLHDGLAPLAGILDRTDFALPPGADANVLHPLVLAKLAGAWALASGPGGASAGVSLADLPPSVAFAHGLRLVAADGTRAQGAAVLEELAQRPGAGPLGAEALWELAVARWSVGSLEESAAAVAALCRIVERFPDSPRAGEAAIKAVELARYSLTKADAQPNATARAASVEQLSALYAQALASAYRLNPASAEAPAWRIEHARMILALAGARPLDPAELDRVLGALEGVPSGTTQRRPADDLARQSIDAAITAARRRAPVAAPDPAKLAALARRGVQWALVRKPELADAYRLVLAEALADGADPRALEIASDLAQRNAFAADPDDAQRIRLRLVTGRAQRLAGQSAPAFATLRELVEEIDAAAGAVGGAGGSRPTAYWLAWAEMLEILAADPSRPDRASAVREQVRRLELVDPNLGGDAAEPARARIRAAVR
jgi:hypothetical protein